VDGTWNVPTPLTFVGFVEIALGSFGLAWNVQAEESEDFFLTQS
jgi:hypothetical protein